MYVCKCEGGSHLRFDGATVCMHACMYQFNLFASAHIHTHYIWLARLCTYREVIYLALLKGRGVVERKRCCGKAEVLWKGRGVVERKRCCGKAEVHCCIQIVSSHMEICVSVYIHTYKHVVRTVKLFILPCWKAEVYCCIQTVSSHMEICASVFHLPEHVYE